MAKGIIYIMTTAVSGLIKIGKTQTDQFKKRMYHLERNGYFNVSGLHRKFAIEVDKYDEKEILLHTIFNKSNVPGSELFAIDVDLAIQLLSSFEGKIIYPENEPQGEIFDAATANIEEEKENMMVEAAQHKKRRPSLTFPMINIPMGTELTYSEDPSVKVTVADERKVLYGGKKYSMNQLVHFLRGNNDSVQATSLFLYNGKSLTDIRDELDANNEA